MFGRLLLLFIAVPLIELAILIQVGQWIGLIPTIALVLVTGTLGALLARSQGGQVLRQIRTELSANRVPAASLLDGLLVLIGGILLLTPGLITDLFGLSLLFPLTRNRMKKGLRGRFEGMVEKGQVTVMGRIQ